jgi:hypothetical protein
MKKSHFLVDLALVCLYITIISVSVQVTVHAWREVLK